MRGENEIKRAILKGVLFEQIIKILLKRNYYKELPEEPERIKVLRSGLRIRGRGEWHEIDAVGTYEFSIPFVYPIRLIGEAKHFSDPVGLPTVRNFLSVLKDISENYVTRDKNGIDVLTQRYTDCGVIFSAEGFTSHAERFAYAHGIFLVSYKSHPIIRKIKSRIKEIELVTNSEIALKNKGKFQRFLSRILEMDETHEEFVEEDSNMVFVDDEEEWQEHWRYIRVELKRIKTSLIGLASGIYPLHILSYNSIPERLFYERDSVSCRIRWRSKTPYHFTIEVPSEEYRFSNEHWVLEFSAPSNVREYIRKHPLVKSEMKKVKVRFFPYIDIPLKINNMRRVIRLELDRDWLKGV